MSEDEVPTDGANVEGWMSLLEMVRPMMEAVRGQVEMTIRETGLTREQATDLVTMIWLQSLSDQFAKNVERARGVLSVPTEGG